MSRARLSPEAVGEYLAKEVLSTIPSRPDRQVAVPRFLLHSLYASGLAKDKYFGEEISQVEHAMQAAKFGIDNFSDEDTVLAALLHDVGHLLPQAEQMPNGLGTAHHEAVGASFLHHLGFPAQTCTLVRRHVDAKRYLCWKHPETYYDKLSEASRLTLLEQGGKMTTAQAGEFELDPLFASVLAMRRWDEAAKATNSPSLPAIAVLEKMMTRAIQRQEYHTQGFVLLRHVLSPQAKLDLVQWAGEIQNWDATVQGKWMIYYESVQGVETLCRTENILPYHAGMCALLQEGELKQITDNLLGAESTLFKEKINYKLPGGGGFPSHQDAPAFSSFGQKNHLTVNVAIDRATEENGCLQVAVGQHQRGLFPQNPAHGGLTEEEDAKLEWTSVPLEMGDVLVFSSWLPHRSGANSTAQQRRALYVTYNAKMDGSFRNQYYAEKREVFPPKNEREAGKDYSEGAKTYNLATPITN